MTSLQGEEEVPEGIMVHFDKTLRMSTYLLYFNESLIHQKYFFLFCVCNNKAITALKRVQ
jgi:hypothetical protein